MITWCYCPTHIILVFNVSCFNYLESLLYLFQHTEIPHPPVRTTVVIIFISLFTFKFLLVSSLTSPGYCDQDSIILVFPIHDFFGFVTGIFSIVAGDYVFCDSGIIDMYALDFSVSIKSFSSCGFQIGLGSTPLMYLVVLPIYDGRYHFISVIG